MTIWLVLCIAVLYGTALLLGGKKDHSTGSTLGGLWLMFFALIAVGFLVFQT